MTQPTGNGSHRPPPERKPRRGGTGGFTAVAAVLVLFLAASSAPSPLYVIYQQQWGFSAWALTVRDEEARPPVREAVHVDLANTLREASGLPIAPVVGV